jgi:HD superfamily phosphodiesterase
MDLTHTIKSAEQQYKQILEDFFISVYDEPALPSHGITHHRRVWNMAQELLFTMGKHNIQTNPWLPRCMIIAAYLHDIGMTVSHGPRHGHHSADFCRKFLVAYNLNVSDFPGLAEAIEGHDNKDYTGTSTGLDLRTILSVADDLDAFGFIGIYRYLEIYGLRGVEPWLLGKGICENAGKRFNNFRNLFSFDLSLAEKHETRYKILDGFFANSVGSGDSADYTPISEIISNSVLTRRALSETIKENIKNKNIVISRFFRKLEEELRTAADYYLPDL